MLNSELWYDEIFSTRSTHCTAGSFAQGSQSLHIQNMYDSITEEEYIQDANCTRYNYYVHYIHVHVTFSVHSTDVESKHYTDNLGLQNYLSY